VDEDGPRGGRGGEAPASFANALPHCAVFLARFFLFRDGGGEGDETGRDGTGRVLFVVFAIAVVGSIVCVVESLFLLCVH
jgi:hypothetical protein